MPVKIDIIILSYAKTETLKQITLQGIESLFLSENPDHIQFEALVIESNKELYPYQYPNTKTIYPDEKFGFNKYLNIGITKTSNEYVCLSNNDLLYHKHWASEILKVMQQHPKVKSANPYCDLFDYHQSIKEGADIIFRHQNPKINGILTGWCLFVKREIFNKTGLLDEQFEFWYADNDYDHTLKKHRLKHALIKRSIVTHLGSQSHDTLMNEKDNMTIGQREKFENKWIKISPVKKLIVLFKDAIMSFR
jgi:GT2 family glycosyltransferase